MLEDLEDFEDLEDLAVFVLFVLTVVAVSSELDVLPDEPSWHNVAKISTSKTLICIVRA